LPGANAEAGVAKLSFPLRPRSTFEKKRKNKKKKRKKGEKMRSKKKR
jgi:hypothetical protein